jgi:hypothetical protein
MAQGKSGSRGEAIKFTTARGVALKATGLTTPMSAARGERVDAVDVDRIAHLVGLEALYRCLACSIGLPCDVHAEDKLLAALKIDVPKLEPQDPRGENNVLLDLWIKRWVEHYGTEEEKAAGKPARAILSRVHCMALAAARKEHGFALLRDAIEGVFSDEWHTKKRRPSLGAVLKDPATFAALLVQSGPARRGGGTLQREGSP